MPNQYLHDVFRSVRFKKNYKTGSAAGPVFTSCEVVYRCVWFEILSNVHNVVVIAPEVLNYEPISTATDMW